MSWKCATLRLGQRHDHIRHYLFDRGRQARATADAADTQLVQRSFFIIQIFRPPGQANGHYLFSLVNGFNPAAEFTEPVDLKHGRINGPLS